MKIQGRQNSVSELRHYKSRSVTWAKSFVDQKRKFNQHGWILLKMNFFGKCRRVSTAAQVPLATSLQVSWCLSKQPACLSHNFAPRSHLMVHLSFDPNVSDSICLIISLSNNSQLSSVLDQPHSLHELVEPFIGAKLKRFMQRSSGVKRSVKTSQVCHLSLF